MTSPDPLSLSASAAPLPECREAPRKKSWFFHILEAASFISYVHGRRSSSRLKRPLNAGIVGHWFNSGWLWPVRMEGSMKFGCSLRGACRG